MPSRLLSAAAVLVLTTSAFAAGRKIEIPPYVFPLAKLGEAREKARSEGQPLAFVFSYGGAASALCRQATLTMCTMLNKRAVIVFVDISRRRRRARRREPWPDLVKAVYFDEGLTSFPPPRAVITDPEFTEVIAMAHCGEDQRQRQPITEARKQIGLYVGRLADRAKKPEGGEETESAPADAVLYPAFADGKWGYIDGKGKMVIKPRYHKARRFVDGLACVCFNKKWGYIDTTGEEVVPLTYEWADEFRDGLAAVKVRRRGYGFIARDGTPICDPQYRAVGRFADGFASVQVENGAFGYIDKTGKTALAPAFESASPFSDGMAAVKGEGWQGYGYLNKELELVVAPQFKSAGSFSEDRAAVQVGATYGYVDPSGELVVPVQFDGAGRFSQGLAPVRRGDAWGYIDAKGAVVIEPQFDEAAPFADGLARVKTGGRDDTAAPLWGYVDKTGRYAITPRFTDACDFDRGLAQGYAGLTFAYIDKAGCVVWPRSKLRQQEPLDVIFVVDTTDSMKLNMGMVHHAVPACFDIFRACGGVFVRVGIVAYRDAAGAKALPVDSVGAEVYHTKVLAPTHERSQVVRFAHALSVGPGPRTEKEAKALQDGESIPEEEDVLAGLQAAVALPRGGRRAFILVCDAAPHADSRPEIFTLAKAIDKEKDTLSVLLFPKVKAGEPPDEGRGRRGAGKDKPAGPVAQIYRAIAAKGGGSVAQPALGGHVAPPMAELALGRSKRDDIRIIFAKIQAGRFGERPAPGP